MWSVLLDLTKFLVTTLIAQGKRPTVDDMKALVAAAAVDEVQLAMLRHALIDLDPQKVLTAFVAHQNFQVPKLDLDITREDPSEGRTAPRSNDVRPPDKG